MKAIIVAVASIVVWSSAALAKDDEHTGRFRIVTFDSSVQDKIFLLDTYTGRTWVTCTDNDKRTYWCPVPGGSYGDGSQLQPLTTK